MVTEVAMRNHAWDILHKKMTPESAAIYLGLVEIADRIKASGIDGHDDALVDVIGSIADAIRGKR